MMKISRLSIGLGVAAALTAVPLFSNTPVLANLQKTGEAIVAAVKSPQIKLNLMAEKKMVTTDKNGKQVVTWQNIGSKPVVFPGDVLRYTVTGQNSGDAAAKDLIVKQPIPVGTVYEIGSAISDNGAKITYSIDGGRTFVDNPKVKLKLANGRVEERPAPATAYTNISWKFSKNIAPKTNVKAMYQVQVKPN